MTKALLQAIKAEYEYTDIKIEELCEKYSCTTKDLKGYTTWKKSLLEPKNNKTHTDSYIKLIYETIYSPEIDDEETIDAEVVDVVDYISIHETADKILHKKPFDKSDLPQPLLDGFEGLRKLDTKLQKQSISFLDKINVMLLEVETPKDLRDLAAIHTSIRDVYFNTKSPMINILNGDVNYGQQSELATLLDGVKDDC